MNFSYQKLKKIVYVYILLPLFLFCVGFLKVPFAILGGVAVSAIYLITNIEIIKREKSPGEDRCIYVEKKMLFVIAVICIIWCFLGGQGGFFYQSPDWDCRNAVFRDLITHSWPVRYETTGDALVYYIGHWLPSAACARGLYLLTDNLDMAWFFGRILLWLWTALGCFLMMMMIALYVEVNTTKQMFLVVFMLIFFSGMDIVQMAYNVVRGWPSGLSLLHLEWCGGPYQYSSNTTCLFWVFNQTIIPWLCIMCYMLENTAENYIVMIACGILAGPFPMVGLGIFMLFSIWNRFIGARTKEKIVEFIKELLSIQNLMALFLVMPVLIAYLSSNKIVASTNIGTVMSKFLTTKCVALLLMFIVLLVIWFFFRDKLKGTVWKCRYLFLALFGIGIVCLTWHYKVFYFVEIGAFLLLLWKDYKSDWKYYVIALFLAVAPRISVGYSNDFMMRASIPALIILMLMIMKSFLMHKNDELCKAIPTVLLMGCVLIGSCTPLVEFYRAVSSTMEAESAEKVVCDPIKTFDCKTEEGYKNFTAEDIDEKIFFRYLAK